MQSSKGSTKKSFVKTCYSTVEKGKFGVLWCGDDLDAAVVEAAGRARTLLTAEGNKIFKKVVDDKQGKDCLLNVLANTDGEIGLRGAVLVPDTVIKGLPARVLKANRDRGTAVPSKKLQMMGIRIKASLSEAHKHGVERTQRKDAVAGETEEPGRGGESFQQPGPQGARDAEVKSF